MRVYICISNRGRKRDHLLFVKASSGVCVDALALLFSNKKKTSRSSSSFRSLFAIASRCERSKDDDMSPRLLKGIDVSKNTSLIDYREMIKEKIKKFKRYEEKERTLFGQHNKTQAQRGRRKRERDNNNTTIVSRALFPQREEEEDKKRTEKPPKSSSSSSSSSGVNDDDDERIYYHTAKRAGGVPNTLIKERRRPLLSCFPSYV